MNAPPVAFFDLDRTLLPHHTSLLHLRLLLAQRKVGLLTLLQAVWFITLYFFNLVDAQRVLTQVIARAAGGLDVEHVAWGEECVTRMVIPRLSKAALERVQWHRDAGHHVCILSASPHYVVDPLARHLGMSALCTRFSVENGLLTGKTHGPLCFGPHKLNAAAQFVDRLGVSLEMCHFYTDSASDLPLLEKVGAPVAVNADPALRKVARARGWSTLAWM